MNIGNKKEWEGPLQLELAFDKEHTKTVRYNCNLDKSLFSFYIPKVVLENFTESDWPRKINVALMKTNLQKSEIGFLGKIIPPRTEYNYWEYDFNDQKNKELVNSYRYDVFFDGQRYSLYVPTEIFKEYNYPSRIIVYFGIPQ